MGLPAILGAGQGSIQRGWGFTARGLYAWVAKAVLRAMIQCRAPNVYSQKTCLDHWTTRFLCSCPCKREEVIGAAEEVEEARVTNVGRELGGTESLMMLKRCETLGLSGE